jgi:putative ABC transport system substrate-binding protein
LPRTRSECRELAISWIGLFDEGFLSGLREHGYEVGRHITVEYRWTEGKTERLPALANELVALKVDAIVTAGAQAVEVAKKATTTIPIVMTSSQDAVGDGLVASLARRAAMLRDDPCTRPN